MSVDLRIARNLRFRSDDGAELWLRKDAGESLEHVGAKAYLWHLYHAQFPGLLVEPDPDYGRSVPDLVATNDFGQVTFWAEAGRNRPGKLARVCRSNRNALIAIARWGSSPAHIRAYIKSQVRAVKRLPEIHLIALPRDFLDTCFLSDGHHFGFRTPPDLLTEVY